MIRVETVERHVRRRAAALDPAAAGRRPGRGRRQLDRASACWWPTPARPRGCGSTRLDDIGVEAGAGAFAAALRSAVDDPEVDAVDRRVRAAAAAGGRRRGRRRRARRSRRPAASRCCRRSSASRACRPRWRPPGRTHRRAARCRPTRRPSARCARWPARCATPRGARRPPGVVPALPDVDLDAARAVVAGRPGRRPGRPRADRRRGRSAARRARASSLSCERPAETVEVELAVFDERSFGALVSFGMAGVATELLGDIAYAAAPLTSDGRRDADPHAAGGAAADRVPAAASRATPRRWPTWRCGCRRWATRCPRSPSAGSTVLATPIGAHVTEVTARVAPPTARADTGPRRLRGL